MTDFDLNKAGAAAALTPDARLMHTVVLLGFVDTGRAPTRAALLRWARARGVDTDPVLAELADRDVVAFDSAGEIRAAYPFSPTPTAIRVSWNGGPTVYAMCAIDALGMSAMLARPVSITAAEPGAGATITIEVDGDKARWSPPSAVVFAGVTGEHCCPSVDRTCGNINFFTTADAARKWGARHPDATGSVLDQGPALNEAVREFGTLLDGDSTA